MNKDIGAINGACHCGGVRFHVTLSDGLHSARRCTCSYCRMRGAVAVSAELAGFRILQGADLLSTYSFNTHSAQHFFCSRCGIYTHHQRRSNPHQYGSMSPAWRASARSTSPRCRSAMASPTPAMIRLAPGRGRPVYCASSRRERRRDENAARLCSGAALGTTQGVSGDQNAGTTAPLYFSSMNCLTSALCRALTSFCTASASLLSARVTRMLT
jgi:hypothetical protein